MKYGNEFYDISKMWFLQALQLSCYDIKYVKITYVLHKGIENVTFFLTSDSLSYF
jgi:hypothetical protein